MKRRISKQCCKNQIVDEMIGTRLTIDDQGRMAHAWDSEGGVGAVTEPYSRAGQSIEHRAWARTLSLRSVFQVVRRCVRQQGVVDRHPRCAGTHNTNMHAYVVRPKAEI